MPGNGYGKGGKKKNEPEVTTMAIGEEDGGYDAIVL